MNQYILPRRNLNLSITIQSGQAFRWQDDSGLRGADGAFWYQITEQVDSWLVDTNADEPQVRQTFGCDDDIDDLCRVILSKSRELVSVLERWPGLRVMRFHDPVEVFFSFLCSANSNIPRIKQMVGFLADHGDWLDAPFSIRRFPSVGRIAEFSEEQLRENGFGYRGRTIPIAARELARRGGEGYLLSLRDTTYKNAHSELISLSGVGPKLADCICLFGLHHTQAVPIDTHIWQAAVRYFRPDWAGKSVTAQRYAAFGDQLRAEFGPYAGWVQQILFYDQLMGKRQNSQQACMV